jgi:hypothetical protein
MYLFQMITAPETEGGGEASPPFTPLQRLTLHGYYCDFCGTRYECPNVLVETRWGTVECLKCLHESLVEAYKCSI